MDCIKRNKTNPVILSKKGIKMQPIMQKTMRKTAGFTLMELMLTIGILAIALTMVSGLFPVAVKESNESYKDIVGTLICENGLAVAKTMITQSNMNTLEDTLGPGGTDILDIIADEDGSHVGIISQKSQHYQEFEAIDYGNGTITDPDYKMQGFLVLGRKVSGSNQLVIVSYARSGDTTGVNVVTAVPISCNVTADSQDITGASDLRIGSPLIDRDSGYYATIITTNSARTEGTLDRPIHPSGGPDRKSVV